MTPQLHHTSVLRASQGYLLERRIDTLKHALAVRGGRIVSIQWAGANDQECSASITYALELSNSYADHS